MTRAPRQTRSPSFKALKSSSARASRALSGSSRKSDTKCEVALRSALWRLGLRFRKNVSLLPGKPDIVFPGARVVVFCDGDFWHGRSWRSRRRKLEAGSNADYWVSKIGANMARDRRYDRQLTALGWCVIRVWEGDILKDPGQPIRVVSEAVRLGFELVEGE